MYIQGNNPDSVENDFTFFSQFNQKGHTFSFYTATVKCKTAQKAGNTMGNVFERTEKKYILNAAQRELLENELRLRMTPDAYGESTIRNIYYDTSDFRLARHSIEKPVYKEKLRVRSYKKVTDGDEVFVELKKKYKGIVYKRRTRMPEKEAMAFLADPCGFRGSSSDSSRQIQNEIGYFCQMYSSICPKVFLSYDRTAYFGREDPDLRISFDRNILWRTDGLSLRTDPGGRPVLDPEMSIMEIKACGAMPLWLTGLLAQANAAMSSFSKYGTVYQILLAEGRLTYLRNLIRNPRIPSETIITGKEITVYA